MSRKLWPMDHSLSKNCYQITVRSWNKWSLSTPINSVDIFGQSAVGIHSQQRKLCIDTCFDTSSRSARTSAEEQNCGTQTVPSAMCGTKPWINYSKPSYSSLLSSTYVIPQRRKSNSKQNKQKIQTVWHPVMAYRVLILRRWQEGQWSTYFLFTWWGSM